MTINVLGGLMKQGSFVQTKSFAFAVRKVLLCQFRATEKREYVLFK